MIKEIAIVKYVIFVLFVIYEKQQDILHGVEMGWFYLLARKHQAHVDMCRSQNDLKLHIKY